MIYALNEIFRQFWKEWALTTCPISMAEPGNERVKESSFKQFSKNVIHSNNKLLPNHSKSLNQTNHSSDNQRVKVNCLNYDSSDLHDGL
jgi:hypothetical protein